MIVHSLLRRVDPADEWLQVALALSIENFLERDRRSLDSRVDPGSLNRLISGNHVTSPAVVHILRIDGWMTTGMTHGDSGVLDSP